VGLERALARHEHRLADVIAVVNSHLHFDHCGNNPLLRGVPIYAQASELEAARAPRYTVPEWIDFEGAEYHPIDGGAQVAAGIRIVATPGHTVGHQSLVLDGVDGPVVLAGQAIYSRTEYDHIRENGALPEDDPPPDPTAYLASALSLIQLDPRRVHFSHGRDVWNRADETE
jgi:N-acyl homoserine lactone hydrolase